MLRDNFFFFIVSINYSLYETFIDSMSNLSLIYLDMYVIPVVIICEGNSRHLIVCSINDFTL